MYALIYVSSAVTPFSKQELETLLNQCARDIERVGITGMLLYKDGNFMQVLEGPEGNVHPLHTKIAADSRHRGLITLSNAPSADRQLPGWSMSCKDLTGFKPSGVKSYNEFLNFPLTGDELSTQPNRAQETECDLGSYCCIFNTLPS